jgi:beta-lactamase class A
LVNSHYTGEMIDLLKRQQLSGGIPKYLPDTSNVANKTGEIGSFKHDAGIVFTDWGDYIIVILSETDDPEVAQEKIAEISKKVYGYFTRKQ